MSLNKTAARALPPAVDIVGCGDIGIRVAHRLMGRGVRVRGWVRSQQSANALREAGLDAQRLDLDTDLPPLAPAHACLFYFAPPRPDGATDQRIRKLLHALNPHPASLIYLSTTGVYGDCQGRWVDEGEAPRPQTDRARRRLDAESAAREWARQHRAHHCILRVPGIYGPGRLPVKRLQQGLPILRPDLSPWSNRIHADDLADACIAAAERSQDGGVYNICDDQPTQMSDYFLRCAALLKLPAPPMVSREQARQQLTPGILSYLAESRRLSNRRMKAELGVVLRYPDLAAGLPASIQAGQ
ncbi:MAG: SDR family oxidoreductase [Panacagrimonas sp.]